MSPEQLSFMIGSIYGSTLALLWCRPSTRSRNRRDPFLDCRDRRGPQFTEGRTIRGNGNGGPTTPKPQFPPGRVLGPNGETIGCRSINYPDPSPDRRPTNPFNGERIPNPPPTQAMNNPPLDEQNCDNCRYKRHRRGEDLCCFSPPQLGASGLMPICPVSRWCGEWAAR